MNLDIEAKLQAIKKEILNAQIGNVKKDILSFNDKVTNFNVYFEQLEDYNVILVYGMGHDSIFSHIYRMVIIGNSFVKDTAIFEDGNAISEEAYTLEDVKQRATNRLKNALKQL